MRRMNFNAGPATLPLAALERAQEELIDFAGTGMSVMEQSHRGKEYEKVHDEALALVREMGNVPSDFEVLFLQGGASMQFAMVPMNFLGKGRTADIVVNGVWGEKAVAETRIVAKREGAHVHVAASTEVEREGVKTYVRVPKESELTRTSDAAYLHVTSNETIHGVQYARTKETDFPAPSGTPLVCDMSSDFLARVVDFSRFDFVYAGAQKNVGPSGLTIVIAKKAFLEKGAKDLPKIFQYRTYAEAKSLFNTPPTFAIYLARNVLSWLKDKGGVAAIEAENTRKAAFVYDAIDRHPALYRCPVEATSRSQMNVVFRLPTPALEDAFLAAAKAAGMAGLKGHRSVGGIRVSLYNAVEERWAEALGQFMDTFAEKHGVA